MRTPIVEIGAMLLALLACDGRHREPEVEPIPVEQARLLYLDHCAICHGAAGDGHGPRRGSLHARPPDFRSSAWRRQTSPARVREVIREGRPGTDMPAWKILDDSEIAGLAVYVLGLSDEDEGNE